MEIHVVFQLIKIKLESYKEALKCDPISAFGGIVSVILK